MKLNHPGFSKVFFLTGQFNIDHIAWNRLIYKKNQLLDLANTLSFFRDINNRHALHQPLLRWNPSSTHTLQVDGCLLIHRCLYQVRKNLFLKGYKVFADVCLAHRGECKGEYNVFARFDQEGELIRRYGATDFGTVEK